MKIANVILILTVLGSSGYSLRAAPYNLATDWSDTSNPNGVWSYLLNGSLAASGTRSA